MIEATASVIKLAVTQDAKDAKLPDFIVNMKKPLETKDIPAAGFEFGLQAPKGQAELDGTYDTYTQIPATDTVAQRAEIVLRDGVIIPEKRSPSRTSRRPRIGRRQLRTDPPRQNPSSRSWEHEKFVKGSPHPGCPFVLVCPCYDKAIRSAGVALGCASGRMQLEKISGAYRGRMPRSMRIIGVCPAACVPRRTWGVITINRVA